MTAARTVYLVTSGEYDSYSVVAVFDDRELAELCQARSNDADIEEYLLNPGADGLRAGLNAYLVHVQRDGTIPYRPIPCVLVGDREGWTVSHDGRSVCLPIWARDEDHARTIAFEAFTRSDYAAQLAGTVNPRTGNFDLLRDQRPEPR